MVAVSPQLLVLVIKAFDHLAEGALTDDLDQLEAVSDMVSLLNTVVALLVVEAVVDESLELRRPDFAGILRKKVELVVFVDLGPLKVGQVLLGHPLLLGDGGIDGKLEALPSGIIDCELVPLRGLRDDRIDPLNDSSGSRLR